MNFLNVSSYSTSSSSTKVLVLDGNNVVKSRLASEIVSDGGVSASVGKIYIATSESGWSINDQPVTINPGEPLPIGTPKRFVIGFKPTNYRLSYWQTQVGNNNIGIRIQFSTSSTDWSSAVNSDVVYGSYDAGGSVIRTGTGTISLGGSAPYYMRILFYNNSGANQAFALQDLTIELWN